jgi:Concanavalin A-like lectin/glucanases superfamily
MWELICDQRYQWGLIAADRSGYRSDGIPTGVAASAYGPSIKIQRGRIAIPRKKPWDELKGIRVEAIARFFDPYGTLISGHDSFRLYLNNAGAVCGEAGGDAIDSGASGVSIQDENWHNITFEHNGLNAVALVVDGQNAAAGLATHEVPGVGPAGVFIGAPTPLGDTDWLSGEIASVRVWRIDPRSMNHGFTDRPLDPGIAKCWSDLTQGINDALKNDPDCRGFLEVQVDQFIAGIHAKLRSLPAATVEAFGALCREYRLLWQANMLDTPQMQDLVARFTRFVKQNALFSTDPQSYDQLLNSPCFQKALGHVPPLTCDPQATALIKFIITELSASP